MRYIGNSEHAEDKTQTGTHDKQNHGATEPDEKLTSQRTEVGHDAHSPFLEMRGGKRDPLPASGGIYFCRDCLISSHVGKISMPFNVVMSVAMTKSY